MLPELLNGMDKYWSFVQYLRHFIRYTNPSKDNSILLIVDNHLSHTSLETIHSCRDNSIVIVGLPTTPFNSQALALSFLDHLKRNTS